MKRKTLATAVLAGVAGAAGIVNISSAVNMNPDGLGEVLIYPFYTVNNQNNTLISVVNTTDTVKAVKVRFLESRNSQEVLDFNLYLSAYDVWVAALRGEVDGGPANIVEPADESSCTVPDIPDGGVDENGVSFGGQDFLTFRLNERVDTDFNGTRDTTLDNTPERTREGHFEMIEMGVVDEDVDPPHPLSPGFPNSDGLEASATHAAGIGGEPNCANLVNAWRDQGTGQGGLQGGGVWGAHDPDHDVVEPMGGLFGGASVINVPNGYQVSYNADAIEAFHNAGTNGSDAVTDDIRLTLHSNPGNERPDLAQANSAELFELGQTADPSIVRTFVFNSGRVIQSDWLNAGLVPRSGLPDPVSALYMRSAIHNEYVVDAALNASTEWVITFPTKRFYVWGGLDTTGGASAYDPNLYGFRPFTHVFGILDDGLGACEEIRLSYYDREENEPLTPTTEVVFSPAPPIPLQRLPILCQETQVVTFAQDNVGIGTGNPSRILGSPNAQNIAVDNENFDDGWASMEFDGAGIGRNRNTADDESFAGRFLGSVDGTMGGLTNDCPTAPRNPRDIDPGFDNTADCYHGLPVTGFAVQVYQNGTLAGGSTLANYAGLFQHRAARIIQGS